MVYFLKKHLFAEYNYEIYDKELMAIIKILRVVTTGTTIKAEMVRCFSLLYKTIASQHLQWSHLVIHPGFFLSVIKNMTSGPSIYLRGRKSS